MLHEFKVIDQEVGIQQTSASFVGDLLTLIANQEDSLLLCKGILVEQDSLTLEQEFLS